MAGTTRKNISSYCCFDLGVVRDRIQYYKNPQISVTGFSDSVPTNAKPELNKKMVTGTGYLSSNNFTHEYLNYNVDTVGGQSGSPVYVSNGNNKYTVIAIHNAEGSNANYGKRIDNNILHFVYNNPNL